MEAKEKGVVLDAKAEAFLADVEYTVSYAEPLAITTTTTFEVIHKDAYDFDVDEGPHAAVAFMAILKQTSPSTREGSNNDTDFHAEDLHKTVLGHSNPLYLKTAQLCRLALYLGDVIVDHVHTLFRVYDSEETLVQEEVSRTKMLERMKDSLSKVSSKPTSYAKINSLYDTFVPQKQLSKEQVYWLPANEVASYNSIEDNLFKEASEYMKIFDELDKEYDQCVIDKKSLDIENKNLLIQNECLLAESVSKGICSVVLTFDIVVPMSVEPRSNYVKEHSKNLEHEAEILKMKQLLVKKEKRWKDDLIRKLKAQISNMKEVSVGPNLSTLEYQALQTKNTQLKEELTTIRIKNDSLRDENVSIKKRYQDLYKSKAESNSNVSSGAAVLEKPKLLAPGLYAITPKTLNKLARKDLVRGLPKLKYQKEHLCPSCQLGKSKKSSHLLKTVNTNTKVLSTLHIDLCRPMRVENINTKKYILRPDNGIEFVNKTLTEFCENVGITHNISVPRTPQQNGAEAVATACYTLNLTLVHTLHGKTYYELLKGKKPEVKYFRGLGCNSMAPGHIGAGPEINNLRSRQISYGLVTTPKTPSVPPTEKQLS
nr:hypothetical protein [Tanacetum cinerariifolium]